MVVLLFSTRFQSPVPAATRVLSLCTILRIFANLPQRWDFLVYPDAYPLFCVVLVQLLRDRRAL